jgi:predicted TIM-barrel fold metal-dependent hydrolase
VTTIDVEAHFYDDGFLATLRGRTTAPSAEVRDGTVLLRHDPATPDVWQERRLEMDDVIAEIGERRIAAMDAAGVEIQVLSLAGPGCEQFEPDVGAEVARASNDALAAAIARHPGRFVGLAALCPDPERPEEAADELERCVTELGFRGVRLNSHVRDTFLDDARYRPIFARAARLGVPVNVHPVVPHAAMIRPYAGYGWSLVGPGLGYGAETAVQTMRLISSGIFDEHPALQIVLGHLGEGLYFWLYRLDFDFTKPWLKRPASLRIERPPSHYLRENVHVTISGHLQRSSFMATLEELGADRIMFASDYPFGPIDGSAAFVESLPIGAAEKEKVLSRNAASLFGLDRSGA